MSLCKCQHPRWMHAKSGCMGEIRVYVEKPEIPPNKPAVVVSPEQLKPKVLDKVMKKGYCTVDCECPVYHTLELGKVDLFGPDGRKL